MLNQVILVGRLVRNPELQITETGRKRSFITLAVPRGYKNPDGEYETDFLDCTLWTGIAENASEYIPDIPINYTIGNHAFYYRGEAAGFEESWEAFRNYAGWSDDDGYYRYFKMNGGGHFEKTLPKK